MSEDLEPPLRHPPSGRRHRIEGAEVGRGDLLHAVQNVTGSTRERPSGPDSEVANGYRSDGSVSGSGGATLARELRPWSGIVGHLSLRPHGRPSVDTTHPVPTGRDDARPAFSERDEDVLYDQWEEDALIGRVWEKRP